MGIRDERDGGSRVAAKEPRAWACSRVRTWGCAARKHSVRDGVPSPLLGVLPGTSLRYGGWGRFPPASP